MRSKGSRLLRSARKLSGIGGTHHQWDHSSIWMDFRLDIWKIRSTTSITTIQLRFSSTRSRFSLDCSLGYCVVQHSSLTTREIKCVEQFWNKILSEEVFLFHRMSACSEDVFLLTVPWTPESMNVCLDIRNVFCSWAHCLVVLLAGDWTPQVDSEIIVDTDGNEDVYRVVGFEVEPKSILHDDPSPAARLTRLSWYLRFMGARAQFRD